MPSQPKSSGQVKSPSYCRLFFKMLSKDYRKLILIVGSNTQSSDSLQLKGDHCKVISTQ